jgi:hypothetical protein
MEIFNAIFLTGIRYTNRHIPPGPARLFIALIRGVIGAPLLWFMFNWSFNFFSDTHTYPNWNLMPEGIMIGIWIFMFLCGIVWLHRFVWLTLVCATLNILGVFREICEFIGNAIILVAFIVWAILSSIVGRFTPDHAQPE